MKPQKKEQLRVEQLNAEIEEAQQLAKVNAKKKMKNERHEQEWKKADVENLKITFKDERKKTNGEEDADDSDAVKVYEILTTE